MFPLKSRALGAILATTLAATAMTGSAIAASGDAFSVSMKDGVVTPQRIEVPANTTVKLVVTNEGTATAEFESKRLHIEKVLAPGGSATLTLRNLAPGSYEFVDEFTEDRETAHGVIIAK